MDMEPQTNSTEKESQITVEDIDRLVTKLEERAQSRPLFRFGVMTLAVAIGSYVGVGRHVARLGRDQAAMQAAFEAAGGIMQTQQSIFDQFFGSKK